VSALKFAHNSERPQIVVLAKAPVPGRVKTRLSPTYSPADAAEIALAALLDTLDAVRDAPASRRFLAMDGDLVSAPPGGIKMLHQRGDGLAERIDYALADAFTIAVRPTLLIGMDTPQITAAHLARAGEQLAAPGVDAVLGLADDGGFWALGLRRWVPGLFADVGMSRPDTGENQLIRLRAAGLRVGLLRTLRDVDTAADAAAVAESAPWGRFARVLRELDAHVEVRAS